MIIKKLSKQKEKIEIFDSDIKKFYEKNKSYCTMPFKEIFSDNAGRYKLCCHAQKMDWKYTANNTTPFKFFLVFQKFVLVFSPTLFPVFV